ncbi:PGPGW domain-containing protein [Nocardioides campestrisoli]|uniref:PGPGW domain-containing protein n=1 Tax=Nocardioides campestrisoli TaxID=2736757 RepID=UPI0015E78214|nr:PGPGW domain-containing protein [Nocardioides campestrisoli]
MSVRNTGKNVLLQGAGWVLVLAGLAALVLPGPGLLALFAGMALLATQYEWAERRLAPVRNAALRTAADSVQTWLRILASVIGALVLIGVGVYWGISLPAPSWWPVDERWWLVGGWGTGATLIGSGLIALGLLVYSYARLREPRAGSE